MIFSPRSACMHETRVTTITPCRLLGLKGSNDVLSIDAFVILFNFPIYILYFGIYYYTIVVKCYFSLKTEKPLLLSFRRYDLQQQKTVSVFATLCIACQKHERSLKNSRQWCKPQTRATNSRVCILLSRILPTPPVFTSGYANTGKKLSIAFIKQHFREKTQNSLLWQSP